MKQVVLCKNNKRAVQPRVARNGCPRARVCVSVKAVDSRPVQVILVYIPHRRLYAVVVSFEGH